jgi:hypothetical protein
MPIYEYCCDECGERFELFVRSADLPLNLPQGKRFGDGAVSGAAIIIAAKLIGLAISLVSVAIVARGPGYWPLRRWRPRVCKWKRKEKGRPGFSPVFLQHLHGLHS